MATKTKPRSAEAKQPDRKEEPLPPMSRGVQRATKTQLDDDPHPARDDEPTAWERQLQENLPPRGAGSQHNQGEDKQPERVRDEVPEESAPEPVIAVHGGGPRGPSRPPS
jgi:hypothetical protein